MNNPRSEHAANLSLVPIDREALLAKANDIMHKPTPFGERLRELLELDQSVKLS